jgi:aspartokinase-like uncharacterized kinase
MTCVVKIGGSLARDPRLAQWLALLAEAGGGRLVIVPGGGPFADQARDAHARWALDDVVAHNMAVLGMVQYALQMHGMCAALAPCETPEAIGDALRCGRTALWMPYELVRTRADALTSFDVTSDTLAAWLAQRLRASALVLVKSCAIPAGRTLRECAAAGIVDSRFAGFVREGRYAVELINKDELGRMRALLAAQPAPGDAGEGAA